MSGFGLAKNGKKQGKSRKSLSQKALGIIGGLFVFLLIVGINLPVYQLQAVTISQPGTLVVTAVVPFRVEFAEAVAKNSRIFMGKTFLFADQEARGMVVFSNSETIFQKQDFVCQIARKDGIAMSIYQGQSSKDGTGEFVFLLSPEMIGENSIQCQAIGYEQPIFVEQQIRLIVWPKANELLSFFRS